MMPSGRRKLLPGFRACGARLACALWFISVAHGASGEGTLAMGRPDPLAKPQAECQLQTLAAARDPVAMRDAVVLGSVQVVDDPLASYQRTPLGDWQMPIEVDRENPWLRFVVFAMRRPVVIDLAVFVDGKPYANGREAWIDGVFGECQRAKEAANAPKTANVAQPPSTETKKTIVPAATDPPKVSAKSREAPNMRERLLAYLATPGPAADRREIRWLIAEWGFGPPVVVMDASLSWQRAGVAPLFADLDLDRSGALEATEIAAADAQLNQADADANDVVDEQELRRKADQLPKLPFVADHPLVVAVDDTTELGTLSAELKRIYRVPAEQAAELVNGPADATLRVEFGAGAKRPAGVALLALGPDFGGSTATVSSTSDVIALDLGAECIEFSAAGGADAAGTEIARTQIAVGAVIDGNPLLRLIDGNQDHRLTHRERQQLADLLASLDRDRDGEVAGTELPIPIRFAVTLGPQVHALLAKPTGAARTMAPQAEPAAPDWFASMDKNGDHDLARGEFLGTAEQFAQIDTNSDGLLSVEEAQEMDSGQ